MLYPLSWSLPVGVQAAVTSATTPGNLAAHVQAEPSTVIRNRRQLIRQLDLPVAPRWLNQIHSNQVVHFNDARPTVTADAIYADHGPAVCAVLTADCLPILLCSTDGEQIAAIHAGWRGLAQGIIQQTLQRFHGPRERILAYLGPAISVAAFEVGDDVRDAFLSFQVVDSITFRPHKLGKWHADICQIAARLLAHEGCHQVTFSHLCTFQDLRWYSYRRQPECGRFASLIWKYN